MKIKHINMKYWYRFVQELTKTTLVWNCMIAGLGYTKHGNNMNIKH